MQSDESDEEPPEALKHAVCFIPCSAESCCQNGKQPKAEAYGIPENLAGCMSDVGPFQPICFSHASLEHIAVRVTTTVQDI